MQNSLLQSMNGNSPTNLINLPALWNHESFWCSELGQTQTVVDWDVFVKHFSEQVKKWANYELNSTQKDFIRTKIDPEHRCEVYKSGFLLFVRDFWEVPSNRTNLFKMKINFSSLFSKLTLLESRPMCHLKITVKYLDEEGKIRLRNYDYNNDNIKDLEMQSFYKVREKGFITIGSHAENDICISDSIHINNFHVKFIAVHK